MFRCSENNIFLKTCVLLYNVFHVHGGLSLMFTLFGWLEKMSKAVSHRGGQYPVPQNGGFIMDNPIKKDLVGGFKHLLFFNTSQLTTIFQGG